MKNLLNEKKKIQLTSVASTVIPLQTAIALYQLVSLVVLLLRFSCTV